MTTGDKIWLIIWATGLGKLLLTKPKKADR